MNDLYSNEWGLFQNFFMPTVKLVEKTRIGARYYRKYDTPKTPYQRVLEESSITENQKQLLSELYKTIDPFQLRKKIALKRQRILRLLK